MSGMSSTAVSNLDLTDLGELLESFSPGPGVDGSSVLIPVLQGIQARYGWLPEQALAGVSRRYSIPLSQIYGVVTFYAQFYLEPRGKHTVRVCRGTACHVRGASSVLSTVEQVLGVGDGETTLDLNFSVETVACLGTCFLAPVMMIDENYYGKLTPAKVRRVFDEFSGAGKPASSEPIEEKPAAKAEAPAPEEIEVRAGKPAKRKAAARTGKPVGRKASTERKKPSSRNAGSKGRRAPIKASRGKKQK
jgi:NADH-quinone oxidoreductase subunit E